MTRWAVFATFAVGHVLSNFVRSANAAIAGDLSRDVGIGPSELGWMTSLYFLAFAVAQLPLGSALDRFGARVVTPMLMSLAVAGAVLFGIGQDVATLSAGRVLLGLGTAGILMGALKALSSWYGPARFAAVSGALVAIGSSGSLIASTPLAWLAQTIGWRAAFFGGAGALAASAIAIAIWGRAAPSADARGDTSATEPPTHVAASTANGAAGAATRASSQGFAAIFASRLFWRAAALAIATTGVTFALQSLWAGPYLANGVGLGGIATGNVLAAFGIGVSGGYALLGLLGERFGPARVLVGTTAAFVACQLVLATVPSAGSGVLAATFVLLGLAGASSALLFALVRASFPAESTGRAVTALNLFMFAGGFAVQWGLGAVVETAPSHGGIFVATALLGAAALVTFLPVALRRSA